MAARTSRRNGSLSWWVVISLATHGALVTAAIRREAVRPVPVEPLYTVDLVPPKGLMQGEVNGKGTPLPFRAPASTPKAPAAEARRAADAPVEKGPKLPPLPADPEGLPPAPTASALSTKELKGAALRDAVRKAMLAPEGAEPSPVEGTGTAAPIGAVNGVPGGTGKPKVSAAYASVLSGWFASRLHCKGLNLPWEEMKTLHAQASVSITPDRKVASFSLAAGGNGTYDACVQSMLQSLVSQGTTLPESPEGEDPPPRLTVNFHCRNKDQCS